MSDNDQFKGQRFLGICLNLPIVLPMAGWVMIVFSYWITKGSLDLDRHTPMWLLAPTMIYWFVCYRVYLHPLSAYPGPRLASITDLYNVYHCLKGDRHLHEHHLHKIYGPVVRVGPNRLSFNSTISIHDIYGPAANTQKSDFYTVYHYFFKVPSLVTTIDKNAHASRRRLMAKALNAQAVQGLQNIIYRNCERFSEYLQRGKTEKVPGGEWTRAHDLSKATGHLQADMMGDMTFSRNWNMLRSEENHYIREIISQGSYAMNTLGYMRGMEKLGLYKLIPAFMMRDMNRFFALSKDQSDWRMSAKPNADHEDLFATLLRAQDPETGQKLSQEQLVSEAGLLIIAGMDTTASALTATIFYLLHYPAVYEILKREIRDTWKELEHIRVGKQLNDSKYLTACIDEALRLTPPLPGNIPREVMDGGAVIDGQFVPAGVTVGVSAYGVHHQDKYFDDPFVYRPGRWLEDEGENDGEMEGVKSSTGSLQSAFIPFGFGRTSCIGKYLAYQEMKVILARLIWAFDMRLSTQEGVGLGEGKAGMGRGRERKEEFQTWEQFTSWHEGPMVEFRLRSEDEIMEAGMDVQNIGVLGKGT
ncbi:hypothetical protein DSL72_002741 [Monilinia vaccinii-corymbosi]|uniref:Uncharacterized protein n=1 Tax=Monilinia vaccinii-corymbosi TaxID=61207 RepID=A0A8A3PDJ3_9HELO|nr:hypothetical protein DSL72_002741 [Monilinia vaccinii-corymbosi]